MFLFLCLCQFAFLGSTRSRKFEGTVTDNVLLIVVDNLRPELTSFGSKFALTPTLDKFASQPNTTTVTRAFCQLAWCAPSRSSFLTGRRPDATHAWTFTRSFRDGPNGTSIVTLPQYFKQSGYYTTSIGKVFHPHLPANFDYPASWTDEPFFEDKPECPHNTMSCSYNGTEASTFDVDTRATDVAIQRLERAAANASSSPFFIAVGYQSPRLPWSFPVSVTARYPPVDQMPTPLHPNATRNSLEWFRPTEIDLYSDVRNVSHDAPMPLAQQQRVRLAYYATVSHVDDQITRLLASLSSLGLDERTTIVICSDHSQSLGEENMFSMMNLLDTALKVPLFIRSPRVPRPSPQYTYPIELVDLFPTIVSLVGLPPPPFPLPGTDLTPALTHNTPVKPLNASLSQITRCHNCKLAYYLSKTHECKWDAVADRNYTVPCCMTPVYLFDYMGMSIRTLEWRYTLFCRWDGLRLTADWDACHDAELFDHRNETQAYTPNNVFEHVNVVGEHPDVAWDMRRRLQRAFTPHDVNV